MSINNSKLALFLLGSASLVNSCRIAPKTAEQKMAENPINYIMSEEHKNDIYQNLINAKKDKNALAKLDTTKAIKADIDLETFETIDENGNISSENISVPLVFLEGAIKINKEAKLRFQYEKENYSAKISDIVEVMNDFKKFVAKDHPDYEPSLDILHQDQIGISASPPMEGEKTLLGQVTTGSLVYLTKKALRSGMAHEFGHMKNKNIFAKDFETQVKNELQADSAAAELTSPQDVIDLHVQVAAGYQHENRELKGAKRDKYLNSTKSFGFDRTIKGDHPGAGRSVQYLEMLELFKQKKIDHVTPPPAQNFIPKK